MNDARKLRALDRCRNLASLEELSLEYNDESIFLYRPDGEGDYSLFFFFNTIEETEAFLTGYCKANGHDV